MRHSTRFAYLSVLFLLFLAQNTKAQTPDEPVIAVARELADTYSKTVSIVGQRLFGSFLPQPDKQRRLCRFSPDAFKSYTLKLLRRFLPVA